MSEPRRRWDVGLWGQVGFYTGLGFIIPGAVAAGYLLGRWVDGKLDSKPLLAIVGAVLGAAAGIIEVLRLVTRAERKLNGDDEPGDSRSG